MDDEIKGSGNSLDFGDRVYDCRLGLWLSIDKMWKVFPSVTPFIYALDNPIRNLDKDGSIVSGDVHQVYSDIALMLEKVDGADAFLALLKIQEDGTQFQKIDEEDFKAAMSAMSNLDAKALAKGYYEAINSSYHYDIHFVDDQDEIRDVVGEESGKQLTWTDDNGDEVILMGSDLNDRILLERRGLLGGGEEYQDGLIFIAEFDEHGNKLDHINIIVNRQHVNNPIDVWGPGRNTSPREPISGTTGALFKIFWKYDDYIKNIDLGPGQGANRREAQHLMENLSRRLLDLPPIGLYQQDPKKNPI